MRNPYRIHIFARWGWRSNYRIAKCFLAWLNPSLRYALLGGPARPEARLPTIGLARKEFGLHVAKIGPLALCWWED